MNMIETIIDRNGITYLERITVLPQHPNNLRDILWPDRLFFFNYLNNLMTGPRVYEWWTSHRATRIVRY